MINLSFALFSLIDTRIAHSMIISSEGGGCSSEKSIRRGGGLGTNACYHRHFCNGLFGMGTLRGEPIYVRTSKEAFIEDGRSLERRMKVRFTS